MGEDDYLSWVNRESITLQSLVVGDTTDDWTDHALTDCKRRAIRKSEVIASNGVYSLSNLVWIIPSAVLPVGVKPVAHYRIKDSAGQIYNILEVVAGKWNQTFKCITVLE